MNFDTTTSPELDVEEIIDAFTVDASTLYCRPDFRAHAVSMMADARGANGFRCRFYICPSEQQLPLTENDTTYFQVKCPPGTLVWGLYYYDPSASVGLQLSDGVGNSLYSEPITSAFLGMGSTLLNAGLRLLTRPWSIPDPGLINVEFHDIGDTNADTVVQLILCTLEPLVEGADCENDIISWRTQS